MKRKTEKQIISLTNRSHNGKKYPVILGLVFVLSFVNINTSLAQFQYGIKAGIGGTCQSELLQLADNNNIMLGYSLGFNTKYRLSDGFAIQSGLEYAQKGRKIDEANLDLTEKLHYLHLPVRAEFSAGEKAGFKNGQRIYFAAGPYVSYLIDADGKKDGANFDLKDNTKDFDLGLSLEIGFEFPVFTSNSLQLGLNYDMGFLNVYKNETDLNNKMAVLSLGFFF